MFISLQNEVMLGNCRAASVLLPSATGISVSCDTNLVIV